VIKSDFDKSSNYTVKEIFRSHLFNIDEMKLNGECEMVNDGSSFTVLMNIRGDGNLEYTGGQLVIHSGDTVLVPAGMGRYSIKGDQSAIIISI
jgi:mannose-6-phosphate isomerase